MYVQVMTPTVYQQLLKNLAVAACSFFIFKFIVVGFYGIPIPCIIHHTQQHITYGTAYLSVLSELSCLSDFKLAHLIINY
jgi:hypothetical protein